MVAARFTGSMATAVAMGWLWARFGKAEWFAERALRKLPEAHGRSRWLVFAETARADLVDAGGFLVVGGLTAAALNVLVPREWLTTIGDHIVLGIVIMAVLAVVLALCSEAEAFVGASLSTMPTRRRAVEDLLHRHLPALRQAVAPVAADHRRRGHCAARARIHCPGPD